MTAPAEGQIAVGPAGSTRRACEPSVMDVESRFLQALSQVQRWQRQDGELVLSGSGDSLRFIATPVGDQP